MSNAESDVKLIPGQVKIEAWDLCIDSKDRRKNDTTHRRALVHDYDDRLTLNWGKDYPGGVKIQGNTVIDGSLSLENGSLTAKLFKLLGSSWLGAPPAITLIAKDLILMDKDIDASMSNVALSHTEDDTLTINREKGYKGGVKIEGDVTVPDILSVQKSLKVGGVEIVGKSSQEGASLGESHLSGFHTNLKITNNTIEVTTTSSIGKPDHQPSSSTLDLVAEIKALRNEVNELKKK